METTLKDLKDAQEVAHKSMKESQDTNNDRLTAIEKNQGTAELEAKFDKISKDVLKGVEADQEYKQRLAALESQKNSGINEVSNKEEIINKINKKFSEFSRSGDERKSFDSFLTNAEKKELSVGTDSDSGFLVMPAFQGVLKSREFETSPMRNICSVITATSDSVDFVIDNGESTSGGWVGETTAPSTTATPTIGKKSIVVYEQYAQPKATQKTLDDSSINIEAWLAGKTADILGRNENTAIVSGSTADRPTGFTTYANWATAGAYQSGAIEQIASGASANFTVDGLMDIQNSLLEFYQTNATWVLNRTSVKEILKLKTSDGEYLLNRTLDKNSASAFMLMGRPMVLASDMAVVGANNLAAAYGDFRAGYTIVDRAGIKVLRDPFTAKPYVKFYTTKRVGGDVVNYEAIKIQKLATSV
tara:strand:+ start:3197 stop:4450 length:1254 start_codon:yes stop_codon:yes gene_type:complete